MRYSARVNRIKPFIAFSHSASPATVQQVPPCRLHNYICPPWRRIETQVFIRRFFYLMPCLNLLCSHYRMSVSEHPTLLLANGAFPAHAYPRSLLDTASRIVCCDGAADRLIAQTQRIPDWIVGDGDSLSPATKARFADRLVVLAEQETNDLSKAFRFCLSHGWNTLTILGLTGAREDHTLANIALLLDFANQATITAYTDHGQFIPTRGGTYPAHPGQQISLFAMDPSIRVSSHGLKYPLVDLSLARWWTAALNEAQSTSFHLTLSHGQVLIFQSYTTEET